MEPTRLVAVGDVARLAELQQRNRAFLAPWDPIRPESFFTTAGQRADVLGALRRHEEGTALPQVILDEEGVVVGRVSLTSIVRGPFQSASLGYWLDEGAGRRGLATAAVAHVLRIAFGPLRLHRVEAGTLRHNVRSQAVLERNGFVRFGLAPEYLNIAGRYQDHVLFQRLAGDPD